MMNILDIQWERKIRTETGYQSEADWLIELEAQEIQERSVAKGARPNRITYWGDF